MSASSDKLLDERHEAVMKGIDGIHARLDALNGRTRKAETAIAILQWGYGLGAVAMMAVFGYFMKGM